MYFADFKCEKCGEIVSVTKVRIADDFIAPKKCKECNGRKFYRIYSNEV